MADRNSTFMQLPADVNNPVELRRFLDKLMQQLDIAFGNRGTGGFVVDNNSTKKVKTTKKQQNK